MRTSPPPRTRGIASCCTSVGSLQAKSGEIKKSYCCNFLTASPFPRLTAQPLLSFPALPREREMEKTSPPGVGAAKEEDSPRKAAMTSRCSNCACAVVAERRNQNPERARLNERMRNAVLQLEPRERSAQTRKEVERFSEFFCSLERRSRSWRLLPRTKVSGGGSTSS